MKKILFIGLGNMGYPMACNLLKAGYEVYGYDVFPNKKEDFIKEKGQWAEDLKTVAPLVDIVISMLPGHPEMEKLYLTDQNLFSLLKPNTLIVDCSTADPKACTEIAKKAEEHNLKMICAPVSGGTAGAEAGTLTFMVGGEGQFVQEAEPLFSVMGSRFFHAGGVSAGQAAKVCNNMLLAIHMIGSSEAFALGESLGLKPEKLNEILRSSSGNNWSLEKYNPYPGLMEGVPSSRNYEGGFSVKLMLKDLGLALSCIQESKKDIRLGTESYNIYKKHLEEGYEKKDFSHILQSISKEK